MSTLHSAASRFNPISAARQLPDENVTLLIPCGRAAETAAALADVDDDTRALAYWGDFEQGLDAFADDMACQRADDVHARELTAAVATACESAGVANVAVSRTLEQSKAGRRITYHARVDGHDCCHFGAGDTPAAAVESMLERLDAGKLTGAFGGFRVTGVAFVGGFPHRSRDEARMIARRIVLDPAYLDAALSVQLDGLTDLRPRPAAAAVAAVAA
jgi:hypothetical protein